MESSISRVRTSGWVQLLSLLEQPTPVLSSSHVGASTPPQKGTARPSTGAGEPHKRHTGREKRGGGHGLLCAQASAGRAYLRSCYSQDTGHPGRDPRRERRGSSRRAGSAPDVDAW